MWLAVALSIVGLGLILIVIFALSAWRRWQKLSRAGGRFSRRVGALGDLAGELSSRLSAELPTGDRFPNAASSGPGDAYYRAQQAGR